jgi:hypothetical protein
MYRHMKKEDSQRLTYSIMKQQREKKKEMKQDKNLLMYLLIYFWFI